jgi:hypothetical protein
VAGVRRSKHSRWQKFHDRRKDVASEIDVSDIPFNNLVEQESKRLKGSTNLVSSELFFEVFVSLLV